MFNWCVSGNQHVLTGLCVCRQRGALWAGLRRTDRGPRLSCRTFSELLDSRSTSSLWSRSVQQQWTSGGVRPNWNGSRCDPEQTWVLKLSHKHWRCVLKVLDLPGSAVETASSAPGEPAGAYKAAVDHFIQTGSRTSSPAPVQTETSPPEVQESQTLLLQKLIGSAKTLTAKEDLLSTLRSDSVRTRAATGHLRKKKTSYPSLFSVMWFKILTGNQNFCCFVSLWSLFIFMRSLKFLWSD